ncbi:RNA polymerase sigma factor [Devriesea agamarum]|uniref:RNA polymerase sigma factor n=1 Tax=Devriesea agamarum TaxID=472569 RepID=UPI00071E5D88|nr:RNA polymerase sigma factor [Devriesea agamarum]
MVEHTVISRELGSYVAQSATGTATLAEAAKIDDAKNGAAPIDVVTTGTAVAADPATLVARAKDGDSEAFACLIARLEPGMVRYACRFAGGALDAEDLVQDTLVDAWRSLGDLDRPEAMTAWVYRSLQRRCASAVRTAARRATRSWEPDCLPEGLRPWQSGGVSDQDPADVVEQRQLVRSLGLALDSLDAELRVCWLRREVDQMSYEDIARVSGVQSSTVRGRLARARTKLAASMGEWR